jgi:hypothetical protein
LSGVLARFVACLAANQPVSDRVLGWSGFFSFSRPQRSAAFDASRTAYEPQWEVTYEGRSQA